MLFCGAEALFFDQVDGEIVRGLRGGLRVEKRLSCVSCTGQRGCINFGKRCICEVGAHCAGLLSPDLGYGKYRSGEGLPVFLDSQDKWWMLEGVCSESSDYY